IVNDTTGEGSDGAIDAVALETGAAIAVMHSRGTPATMKSLTRYADVVTDVRSFLIARARELRELGIASDSIVLDPGIGFAKDPSQNLLLLKRLRELVDVPAPLLIGTSRKSFIGAVLDLDEDERLEGTIATVVAAVLAGARIVRVHDVEPVVRAIRMTEAIMTVRPSA
ncbi:MAG TPA: dihydropteroate synthase, partial [Actinomycetota bacterium]|nr:dihydropteroate synthase [Actinomycetota bacterium]